MELSIPSAATAPVDDTRRSTRVAVMLEKLLGNSVETIAAALIAAEIGILLAGVVARYFLHTPLVWADEAASLLFLCLASLAAVVALRRGEHMRMTALVSKVSPGLRAWLETVAVALVSGVFCLLGPVFKGPGSVLEGIPAIVLFGPLLFPIERQIGVHEVHYAMVVVLSMGVGLFAPPFGVGHFAACAVGRVEPSEGMKPIVGHILALLVGLAVVAALPWISIGFL